jgi:hypothetical protein
MEGPGSRAADSLDKGVVSPICGVVRHSGPVVIGQVAPANALRHEHQFREGIAERLGAALVNIKKLKIHRLAYLSLPRHQ